MSNAADSQAGLMGLRIIDVQVGAWCPTQDGPGPAQGVGMALTVARGIEKCDLVFVIRSPEAVNRLCESLLKIKNSVWPATPPAAHAACEEGEAP